MNITNILADLRSERNRIDRAIAAIEGLSLTGPVHTSAAKDS